jgi:DNA repair protein RecO (recombination protein O)
LAFRFEGQILFFGSICQIFLCPVLRKSLAIALHSIPYRDSSVIARFFTEDNGLQSFIASGVRAAKTKLSPSLFQPLSLTELVYYFHPGRELHRLAEIRCAGDLSGIQMHPAKTAMAMFVAEYLGRVLKEQLENKPLFALTGQWMQTLNRRDSDFESAHLGYLWQSFSSLGIAPENWVDLCVSGRTDAEKFRPFADDFFDSEDAFFPLRLPSEFRKEILDLLVEYATRHLEGMGQMKSLTVLRQVFS